jgi:hypothetical protein
VYLCRQTTDNLHIMACAITVQMHCTSKLRALLPRSLKLPCTAEVNASPSLSTDTAADHQLKWGLVEDALGLVDVESKLEGQFPLSFGG